MPYKIEIHSTQFFSDGKFLNHSEDKWFENDHELTARNEAFSFLLSFPLKESFRYNIDLFFCYDGDCLDKLCSVTFHPIEEYSKEEIENRDFYFEFDVENLHDEYENYLYTNYDTGGEPLTLDKYLILDSDDNEISPIVLAVNKKYLDLIN